MTAAHSSLYSKPVNHAVATRQAEEHLTERERQTLSLIAEGLSNKLIARRLGISDGTVKIHVRHLLGKLNLGSRQALAAWALQAGLSRAARVPRYLDEVSLTEREAQTLALIADGHSNRVIADRLGISDATVKTYVSHLLLKLEVHSRLELVSAAHQLGLAGHHPHDAFSPPPLDTLMQALPVMLYRCHNNRLWSMEYVSPGCLNLTGYQPEHLVADQRLAYNSLIHPDDRELVWRAVQSGLRRHLPISVEYRVRCLDGQEKTVQEHACGVYSASGEVLGIEGLIVEKLLQPALSAGSTA